MTSVIQLICQGETLANRHSRFPFDDPLTKTSLNQIHQLKACFGPFSHIWTATERASWQTAQGLGLCGEPVAELAEPGTAVGQVSRSKRLLSRIMAHFNARFRVKPHQAGKVLRKLWCAREFGCRAESRTGGSSVRLFPLGLFDRWLFNCSTRPLAPSTN